jgi:hypothetical protein
LNEIELYLNPFEKIQIISTHFLALGLAALGSTPFFVSPCAGARRRQLSEFDRRHVLPDHPELGAAELRVRAPHVVPPRPELRVCRHPTVGSSRARTSLRRLSPTRARRAPPRHLLLCGPSSASGLCWACWPTSFPEASSLSHYYRIHL